MKKLLNDCDKTYGDTLYRFFTNIELLRKLLTTNKNILNNYKNEQKFKEKHLCDRNLIL